MTVSEVQLRMVSEELLEGKDPFVTTSLKKKGIVEEEDVARLKTVVGSLIYTWCYAPAWVRRTIITFTNLRNQSKNREEEIGRQVWEASMRNEYEGTGNRDPYRQDFDRK